MLAERVQTLLQNKRYFIQTNVNKIIIVLKYQLTRVTMTIVVAAQRSACKTNQPISHVRLQSADRKRSSRSAVGIQRRKRLQYYMLLQRFH